LQLTCQMPNLTVARICAAVSTVATLHKTLFMRP